MDCFQKMRVPLFFFFFSPLPSLFSTFCLSIENRFFIWYACPEIVEHGISRRIWGFKKKGRGSLFQDTRFAYFRGKLKDECVENNIIPRRFSSQILNYRSIFVKLSIKLVIMPEYLNLGQLCVWFVDERVEKKTIRCTSIVSKIKFDASVIYVGRTKWPTWTYISICSDVILKKNGFFSFRRKWPLLDENCFWCIKSWNATKKILRCVRSKDYQIFQSNNKVDF